MCPFAGRNEIKNKKVESFAEELFALEAIFFFLRIGRIVRIRIVVCVIRLGSRFRMRFSDISAHHICCKGSDGQKNEYVQQRFQGIQKYGR